MITALDMIKNENAEIVNCITIDGITFVDRWPSGGVVRSVDSGNIVQTVFCNLIGDISHTEQIPRSFSPSQTQNSGNIRLINPIGERLPNRYNLHKIGLNWIHSVCGVIDKGLSSEQTILFEDRLQYRTGFTTGATDRGNEIIIGLGGDSSLTSKLMLVDVPVDGSENDPSLIDFISQNDTRAVSNGSVSMSMNLSDEETNNPSIVVNFSDTISDIDVSIERIKSDVQVEEFIFSDVSDSMVRTAGVIASVGSGDLVVTIELINRNQVNQSVKLSFSNPIESAKWAFQGVNVETISNWSVVPSITPPFGGDNRHFLTWKNLGGIKEITFDLNAPNAPTRIFVPSYDSRTRPHIVSTPLVTSFKLWPESVIESLPLPTNFNFTPPDMLVGDSFPDYSWTEQSIDTLSLSCDFIGVSSTNPIQLIPNGNKVDVRSGDYGFRYVISRVRAESADIGRVSVRPLLMGTDVKNVTPLDLSEGRYDLGDNCLLVSKVKSDGVDVPLAGSLAIFNQNKTNSVVSYFLPSPFTGIFETSGEVGQITAYASSLATVQQGVTIVNGVPVPDGDPQYLPHDQPYRVSDFINQAIFRAGINLGALDEDLGLIRVGGYFSNQLTFGELMNAVLAPIDAFYYFVDGSLFVESRATYSTSIYDYVIEDTMIEIPSQTINNELTRKAAITVHYDRNYTPQPNVPETKNEYKKLTNSSTGTTTYNSFNNVDKSELFETFTHLVGSQSAQRISDLVDREKLRQAPQSYFLAGFHDDLKPNSRVKINIDSMPQGMFLPELVRVLHGQKKTFVSGTYYYE